MKNIPIGAKLIGSLSLLLVLVCGGLGYIAYDRASTAVTNAVHENMPTMAEEGAKLVRSRLDYHLLAVQGVANRHVVRSMDWSLQAPALEDETKRLGYLGMGIIAPNGQARYPDGSTADLGDRDYFKAAMAGETVASDVIISRVTNSPVMITAAPIRNERGQVAAVLIARLDATMFSLITDEIKYGRTGYSYIIDGKGTLIAHGNRQYVLDQRNFIEEARTDPQFARLAQMLQRMTKGERGYDEYYFAGSDRYFGYAPIPGTKWSIAVGAVKDDVMADVYALRSAIAWASAAFLFVGVIAALLISRVVTGPVRRLMAFAGAVAGGDLKATSGIDQKDEIGKLNVSIQQMVDSLIAKMEEAEEKSRLAAQETEKARQATAEAEQARKEAEQAKRQGMLQAAGRIEGIVERMTSASEELSAQVEQASRGSEEQKHRVAETATAMEEMNATVIEVARNASQSAADADNAKGKAQGGETSVREVIAAIEDVKAQAEALQTSMEGLGRQAEDIGRIIGVIEDIADQTNLLALNAAIEAARAGDAGRGFAVVADEVRKLAEKTMSATKEVGQAISSIQGEARKSVTATSEAAKAVAKSTTLAEHSGAALMEIVTIVSNTAGQVASIATAAEQQSATSEEINRAIEDISRISNETAQVMSESAKAISDLARQASELQALVEDLKS
ncbi:methyl-accepting chemotaxis sensory transducer with Cache sensor [Alkalidesulfovibrio alkalitolerans DSM 16529]|uniref:Methyl-accepting chemotaxis sensory transducer with Cache sensor n=1 Tax=Alkalidesulfovibrio alkalitolerans DSM 16529 TaxID=1121439 RepID=S7TCI9_9BACT|nr:methyl-accepting chemotaxis protein [Alkalidesulfovibrio alkalitolerans]EPR34361.1 methyl-accepting chemotaxis sensory transducer with Cache sensor [Alkalidesulfovibrio alkalitolerans DSM 16529]